MTGVTRGIIVPFVGRVFQTVKISLRRSIIIGPATPTKEEFSRIAERVP